jgi:hypothetical protein
MENFDEAWPLAIRRPRSKGKANTHALRRESERRQHFGDFRCRCCQALVLAAPALSGVNHRNHCPYCLWSRHMDLRAPGDRLSACKGLMRPVGLTFKRRHKRYVPAQPGELMVVHQCAACGTLSINRTAADDLPARLWDVFQTSLAMAPETTATAARAGIDLLSVDDSHHLRARLGLAPVAG